MDSYNSRYPYEYYEVGTCYAFYTKDVTVNSVTAPAEAVELYGSMLESVSEHNAEGYAFAKRVAGVVVNKEVNPKNKTGMITVLFAQEGGTYILKKYATGCSGVFCDDKEQHKVTGENMSGGGVGLDNGDRSGGVGLDNEKRFGGIGLDKGKRSGGIGLA